MSVRDDEEPSGDTAASAERPLFGHRMLFESNPNPMWIFDRETLRFLEVNAAAERLYGYTRDEFLQRSIADCVPLDDREPLIEHLSRVSPGSATRTRWRHLTSDGRLLSVELGGEPIEHCGRPARMMVVASWHEVRDAGESIEDLQQALVAIRRREAEFRSLAESSPDMIVRFNRELQRIYVNAAVAAANHTPAVQLIGKRPTESFPGVKALEAWETAVAHVFETGETSVSESRADLMAAGNYLQTHLIPEFGPDGSVATVLSITRDLTDVRRAIEANSRLGAIVESSQDGMIVVDLEGRIVSWNRGAELIFGYAAGEVLGQTTDRFFDVDDSNEVGLRERIRDTVITRGDSIENLERRWRRKDGGVVTCYSSYFPIRNSTGEVVGIGSVARDVTERLRSIQALRESEERFRMLADAAPLLIWVGDREGKVEFFSAGWRNYTGNLQGEDLGDGWRSVIHPDDLENVAENFAFHNREQSAYSTRYRLRRHDGVYRWMFEYGSPRFDGEGQFLGLIGACLDVHESVLTEEALRLSEGRLNIAVSAARMGVWTWDTGTGAMEWSDQAARIYGRSHEEMPRNYAQTLELLHPDERAVLMENRGTGQTALSEYRIRMPDGDYRWVTAVGESVIDDGGASRYATGIIQDIHERKLSEVALRESEERFREVVESISAGVWVYDGVDVLMVNGALERITGYSREQLTTRDFLRSILHKDDVAELVARGAARIRGEAPPDGYEVRIHRADGDLRVLELQASRVTFQGTYVSLVSAFDVTERKRAEQSVFESEARFRGVVEGTPDMITRYDADLRFEFGNAVALRALDSVRREPWGKRIDEMRLDPEFANLWLEKLTLARDTAATVEFEYDTPTSYGNWYRRARIIPERDEAGTVHHLLCVVTDMTVVRRAEEERRRLDQQMQQTQKLESLGVLAGGIAHDFNNLLVAILGNAGLALMELPRESPARQTVAAIETAAQRAAELTRQMLAYSGKGRFVIEPLDLSKVVEEMAHLLEVSVSKRAALKYNFASGLAPIEADATQVRQVIMNLITNASDSLGERDGVISVSTGQVSASREYLASSYLDSDLAEGDYVFVEVADTGEGMAEATIERIFDPFFTTKFFGRGLGLAAVLGIVRGHGGAIKLSSEEGKGSAFRVLFPAAQSAAVADAAASPAPESAAADELAAKKRLLVVDDDDTVRSVTKRMLEHAGFEVLQAADGIQALDAYSAGAPIDLVLLDMTMPHMDGEECFRELRKLNPQVRVVLTSGYTEQDAMERFVGTGLAGFIQKPYRPAELVSRINEVLAAC